MIQGNFQTFVTIHFGSSRIRREDILCFVSGQHNLYIKQQIEELNCQVIYNHTTRNGLR